ncbi:MAG: alginate export family protein [Bacteroidia bacterium]|nr:alginate export family protein [Bacteroidia bacterium]
MKQFYFLLLSMLIITSSNIVSAQEKESEFTIKAQLRPRAEYRHGVISPMGESSKASSFISNRARLSLGFDNGFLALGASAQDVAVWGERAQIENTPRTSGINEAWAKIYKNGFFVQLGRQQLTYDDDRILGTLDWHQAGRFHDVLKAGYENTNNKIHLILAYNQDAQRLNSGKFYAGGQPYKTMQTAWYQFDNKENFTASLLLMNLGFETGIVGQNSVLDEAKTSYMQTIGTNLSYKINDLSLYGTVYYQMGKNWLDKDINAYMFAAKGQYKFTPVFSVALGLDYLSGQKANNEKVTNFNPLYGTHHKFYGAMDYFYASLFGDYGLVDFYGSLIFKPMNKFTIDLTYHNFSSQQPIKVVDVDKKGLGSEIDLTVTYPIRPYIVLQGGYSMMFGTDAFFQIKGGSKDRTQNWAFLSLNVNPTIFKGKF